MKDGRREIPHTPWEIQDGLKFLMPMSDMEKVLKELWLKYPEYRRLDKDSYKSYFELLHKQIRIWDGPEPDNDLLLKEEVFIPKGVNVAAYKQACYFPTLLHSHDFFELTCIIEGECTYEVLGRKLLLRKGDLMLVPPGMQHALSVSTEDMLFLNILIRKSTFNSSFLHIMAEKDVLAYFFNQVFYGDAEHSYLLFRCGDDKEVFENMYVIYSEFNHGFSYKKRMLESILNGFFIILLRKHEQDVLLPNTSYQKDEDNFILILNYIQQQYQTVTLNSLAEFFNYSARQMSRLIKGYTGITFSELIQSIKLGKAEELLRTERISVSEVCERAGYSDMTNFYRLFRKKHGCTPHQYRERRAEVLKD